MTGLAIPTSGMGWCDNAASRRVSQPMSLLGHSLPNFSVGDMSVFNPNADMAARSRIPTLCYARLFHCHNPKMLALSAP
jgi:hypothetical protein